MEVAPPAPVEPAPPQTPAPAAPPVVDYEPNEPLAFEEEELAAPSPTGTPAEGLDTVVVTATRIEKSLQDVPVAVSVVDAKQIGSAPSADAAGLSTIVPTVNFRTSASNKDASVFIRGIGTISTSPGVEPSVSTVLDGVVLSRPGQATLELLDLQRIEVLRGPQGTLFGKNASAGVISIVTKAPSRSFTGFADLSYFDGNDSGAEKRVRVGVSGPIADAVRASLVAMFNDWDGNVTNVANGATLNASERYGARAKVEADLTDDLTLTITGDYLHGRVTTPNGVIISTTRTAYPTGEKTPNPAFAAALRPVVPSLDNRSINSDMETYAKDDNYGVSAQLDLGIGEHTLTSISAYRGWKNEQEQDADRLGRPYVEFPGLADRGTLDFSQFSEELRIASPAGGLFEYVAGLYYLYAKDDETYRRDVTRCATSAEDPVATGATPCNEDGSDTTEDFGRAKYDTTNHNVALFGETTINFLDRLRGIAGLRLTRDSVEYSHERTSTQEMAIPGVNPAYKSDNSTDQIGISGRVGPQFDVSDEISTYATYSRGYKGPAFNVFFNQQERDTLALDPETSNSYEIGAKSRFWRDRISVNAAGFYTQYYDYQANFYDTVADQVVTRLINAGEVSTKGIELDLSAQPVKGLTISAAGAWIKARIDSFECPPDAVASCNVDDKPLPFSPDWKANGRIDYSLALPTDKNLGFGAVYRWQSETQYDISQTPDAIQPAYGIFDASISLSDTRKGYQVALLARNLTNESYASFIGTGGTYVYRWVPRDDQRYFGINVRQDF